MKYKVISLCLVPLLFGGCAGRLHIWDDSNRRVVGVPFNAPVLYIRESNRTRHSVRGADCAHVRVAQPVSLPIGERYYANASPALFAKTEFAINFFENGALEGISLNTEPAGADTLRAATEALSSIAPMLGIVATVPLPAERTPAPPCDAGEENVQFIEFEEWQRIRGRNRDGTLRE